MKLLVELAHYLITRDLLIEDDLSALRAVGFDGLAEALERYQEGCKKPAPRDRAAPGGSRSAALLPKSRGPHRKGKRAENGKGASAESRRKALRTLVRWLHDVLASCESRWAPLDVIANDLPHDSGDPAWYLRIRRASCADLAAAMRRAVATSSIGAAQVWNAAWIENFRVGLPEHVSRNSVGSAYRTILRSGRHAERGPHAWLLKHREVRRAFNISVAQRAVAEALLDVARSDWRLVARSFQRDFDSEAYLAFALLHHASKALPLTVTTVASDLGSIRALAFHGEGSMIAVGAEEERIVVLRAHDGANVAVAAPRPGAPPVRTLAFDTKRSLVFGSSGELFRMLSYDGKHATAAETPTPVRSGLGAIVVVSPDGDAVAAASERQPLCYFRKGKQQPVELGDQGIPCFARGFFAHNNRILVVIEPDREIRAIDVVENKTVWRAPHGSSRLVAVARVAGDSRIGWMEEGPCGFESVLADVATGQVICRRPLDFRPEEPLCLAAHDNGAKHVCLTPHQLLSWDVRDREPCTINRSLANAAFRYTLALSADGTMIAFATDSTTRESTAWVFLLSDGVYTDAQAKVALKLDDSVVAVGFLDDGRRLGIAITEELRVYDIESGTLLSTSRFWPRFFESARRGECSSLQKIAGEDCFVVRHGGYLRIINLCPKAFCRNRRLPAELCERAPLYAAWASSGRVELRNLQSDALRDVFVPPLPVESVCWVWVDGTGSAAICDSVGNVFVIPDLTNPRKVTGGIAVAPVVAGGFEPGTRNLLVVNAAFLVTRMDLATGSARHAPDWSLVGIDQERMFRLGQPVCAICTTTRRMAVAGRHSVNLHDAGSGGLVRRVPLGIAVGAMAFSPDGKVLMIGGDDGVVRAFPVAPQAEGQDRGAALPLPTWDGWLRAWAKAVALDPKGVGAMAAALASSQPAIFSEEAFTSLPLTYLDLPFRLPW